MPRLELGDMDLDTSLEIKKRRNTRMFELATNQGSIAEDQSPFSKENMARAANTSSARSWASTSAGPRAGRGG